MGRFSLPCLVGTSPYKISLAATVCDEMKVGLTQNKDDDSEDTPCDERKKTSFQHLKMDSKRVDTISVTSVMNKSKF